MRCDFTGPVDPLYHLRSTLLVHCAFRGTVVPPWLLHWKTSSPRRDIGLTVIVDAPTEQTLEILSHLTQVKIDALLGWDPACRSPGHSLLLWSVCVTSSLDGMIGALG